MVEKTSPLAIVLAPSTIRAQAYYSRLSLVKPNNTHQMDMLYLPRDKFKCKTYKYTLTMVDITSRSTEAEPLTSKIADQVKEAIVNIYKR